MRAGELRHRVTLQKRTSNQSALGDQKNDWSDVATLWAGIEPVSGREVFLGDGMRVEISHVITVRYRAALADPQALTAMRIIYQGRNFNIHAPLNTEERNFELQLLCSEGLNQL